MLPKSYPDYGIFEPDAEPHRERFEIYGIISSRDFQLCKCYAEKLYKVFPQEYGVPYVNAMLDLDWFLFLTRIRREIGGEKLWSLKKQVLVFKNDDILGDDEDFLHFVSLRYKFSLSQNFEALGVQQLIKYIGQQQESGNAFVYFTISIEGSIIGSMLFEIYSKDVPELSNNFIKMCAKDTGYVGKPIQRIVLPSWIQCGGWHMNHYNKILCENYIISHNKRGVLSMCNNGRHKDNCTQFMISLEPTPWMDSKYVAFGQLIYGESILRQIQTVPTHYEEPIKNITIAKCGLYDLCSTFNQEQLNTLEQYLSVKDEVTHMHRDVVDVRDAPSELLRDKYLKKYYCLPTDKRSHLPLLHLPLHLLPTKAEECQHTEEATSTCLDQTKSEQLDTFDYQSDSQATKADDTLTDMERITAENNFTNHQIETEEKIKSEVLTNDQSRTEESSIVNVMPWMGPFGENSEITEYNQ